MNYHQYFWQSFEDCWIIVRPTYDKNKRNILPGYYILSNSIATHKV